MMSVAAPPAPHSSNLQATPPPPPACSGGNSRRAKLAHRLLLKEGSGTQPRTHMTQGLPAPGGVATGVAAGPAAPASAAPAAAAGSAAAPATPALPPRPGVPTFPALATRAAVSLAWADPERDREPAIWPAPAKCPAAGLELEVR